MRQVTLANIIDVANGNDKASTKAAKMRAKNFVNVAKSLDLLRQNLQSSINKEIDNVIRKYLTVRLINCYQYSKLFLLTTRIIIYVLLA